MHTYIQTDIHTDKAIHRGAPLLKNMQPEISNVIETQPKRYYKHRLIPPYSLTLPPPFVLPSLAESLPTFCTSMIQGIVTQDNAYSLSYRGQADQSSLKWSNKNRVSGSGSILPGLDPDL